jgi:hypothetical protein
LLVFTFGPVSSGDTFIHRTTNETLHGYATGAADSNGVSVQTLEKGLVKLRLADWKFKLDRHGRNEKVIVLTLNSKIMLEIETKALVESIRKAADQGPLFILLQINTPGGRTDLTHRICGAITQAWNCRTVAYIMDGKYGGAVSAGAAVAFACDKIYMAENTVIGAATAIMLSKKGPEDFKKVYGDVVGEKINSAWRAYLTSLAEHNDRPGLLAGAMVDKDIEVIEVTDDSQRLFIDPVNKKPQQELVHTWSKKGSLLTLTATEAAGCLIADKVVASRQEILEDLDAEDAEIVIDDAAQRAGKQLSRARLRLKKLTSAIDLNVKRYEQTRNRPQALKLLRELKKDYRSLITLAKRYPDLKLDPNAYERQLNSVEAFYQKNKMRR